MAYVIKKEPVIENDNVCIIKLFLSENKGISKLRLKIDKILVKKVIINNIYKVTFKLLFNFAFSLTKVGPIDELKIVAGNDPTEKQAKNIAAISFG